MKVKRVAIIGAGMMGSALAFPLSDNGYRIHLIGTPQDNKIIDECIYTNRHPKFNKSFSDKVDFFKFYEWITVKDEYKYDFIICGVSSDGVDWFLKEILYKLEENIPVLSVTKGLIIDENNKNIVPYPIYWREKLLKIGIDRHICAIGGPCTSYELVCGDNTEVVFVGEKDDDLIKLKDSLETDYYHISLSNDILGVECMVALKNVYALAIAMTIGLNNVNINDGNIHYNSQAAVFTQSVKEMYKFIDIIKGDKNSLFVGVGDLYVTLYGGRTRKLGILIGEGNKIDKALEVMKNTTLESIILIKRIIIYLNELKDKNIIDSNDFPILYYIYDIIKNNNLNKFPWKSIEFNNLKM